MKLREEIARIAREMLEKHVWKATDLQNATHDQHEAAKQEERYHGVLRSLRGSFGRITSKDVEGDIMLHKSDCDRKPTCGDELSFRLSKNEKGFPKAIDVKIKMQPQS